MTSSDQTTASSSFSPDETAAMAKLGIICAPVDYFYFGGFRYTNLKDAIAQAKRQENGG